MKYLLALIALSLTSCAIVRDYAIQAEVPEHLAPIIDEYRLIPQSERLLNRDAVNNLTEFCDVEITCVGDI